MPQPADDTGSLEEARGRLYRPGAVSQVRRAPLAAPGGRTIPHQWSEAFTPSVRTGKRHIRLAGIFFIFAFLFFLVSLGIAGYFFYFGGNTVSVDNITVALQGPSTIAGGDTVPLSVTVTNRNSVALENATIEIDFPDGTRSATDATSAYPRYIEDLGTIASGASVTRSVSVMLFGGTGQVLTLPVSLSFGTVASNAVFVKKSSYPIAISSTPLSVSVSALPEVTSGAPFTLTLTVRSNAAVVLNNVVLAAALPFGFSVASSSLPFTDASFLVGTLQPNASKTVTLTGTLLGQDSEQKVFHFTIGTAKTPQNQTIAITYMTQDATVAIAAPFITAALAINGDTSANPVVNTNGQQSVTVSYTNTLPTSVENASVSVAVSGNAIDYDSIKTSQGFYRSSDHTVVFSKDTDPSLASLAPDASGIGTFTFSTLAPAALPPSPTIAFTTSLSGTSAGQTGVTESMDASASKTAKVATTVLLSASSLHSAGLKPSGPIPPRADQATTYTISWSARNEGSPVAGAAVSATLPGYVSYTGLTSGAGSFSYDDASHTVSWNIGDLAQDASATGAFQVSLTPSSSQKGSVPSLTGAVSFSGYDRFAGAQITAVAEPVTTETKNDPGYVPADAVVQ